MRQHKAGGGNEELPEDLPRLIVLPEGFQHRRSTCSGTTCTARTSFVRVLIGETLPMGQDLLPGHVLTYIRRNDGSGVIVSFVKGQASSSCAGRTGVLITCPQTISVYIVHIVPPIGSGGQIVQTTPLATPPGLTVPAEERPTPTRSDMLPAPAIGAVALAAILGGSWRK
jgi:hypothetical protein